MKRTKINFDDVCAAIASMPAPEHDLMVVEPTDTVTRFTRSIAGRGRLTTEVSEIPALFDAIKVDVWHALRKEGWDVVKTRRGFMATRRASAMTMVREAA